LPPRQIEAVIFDLDDTLISWSEPAVAWDEFSFGRVQQVRQFLVEAGHNPPEITEFHKYFKERMRQTWDNARQNWIIPSMGEFMHQILLELDVAAEQLDMRQLLELYNWGVYPGVVPFDDTHTVLEEIKRLNYKVGLVTNSIFPMWMRDVELEAYEMLHYFDARVTSGDVGVLKPHPEIYEHILEMLDLRPDQAVFVGDRPINDIAGANEVGLVSVLMAPPHLERELDGVVPDFTIEKLSELIPLLEKLN
jgi:putative hydrolase of the HAD superfamily